MLKKYLVGTADISGSLLTSLAVILFGLVPILLESLIADITGFKVFEENFFFWGFITVFFFLAPIAGITHSILIKKFITRVQNYSQDKRAILLKIKGKEVGEASYEAMWGKEDVYQLVLPRVHNKIFVMYVDTLGIIDERLTTHLVVELNKDWDLDLELSQELYDWVVNAGYHSFTAWLTNQFYYYLRKNQEMMTLIEEYDPEKPTEFISKLSQLLENHPFKPPLVNIKEVIFRITYDILIMSG